VISGVRAKMRSFWQQTAFRLVRATRLSSVVNEEAEIVLGRSSSRTQDDDSSEADHLSSALSSLNDTAKRQAALKPWLKSRPGDPGRPTDMNASVDILAEQMLTLVDIVSAQEKDIKALKEQCRRLEEHDQAIAVAFSTFFHVLSAGRVAKLGEIASILKHITEIAEQEGRPPEAIKFLQDLAAMLPDDQH
jgi:hypothetical protein